MIQPPTTSAPESPALKLTAELVPEADKIIDKKVVAVLVSKRTVAGLKRFGAFVRRRAQTSLRYGKKKSAPGNPPTVHRSEKFTRTKVNKKTGVATKRPTSPYRELIAFAVVAEGTAVIAGPMIFRSSSVGGGVVPRRLEQGGSGVFFSGGKQKRGRWAPRPTMGPAFRKELPSAPKLFAKK